VDVNMLGTGEGKRKGEAWAKAAVWGNLPQSAQQQFGAVENVSSRDFVGVWTQRVQGIPYEGTGLTAGGFWHRTAQSVCLQNVGGHG
jgi:hypothetical protein